MVEQVDYGTVCSTLLVLKTLALVYLMFGKPTWTWNNVDYSYRFMKNTYFKAFDSPWMDVGGLIYVDWNGADTDNAKNRAIRAVRWGYESSSATSEPSQR